MIRILIIFIGLCSFYEHSSFASNIYVDNTLGSNCTSNYSISNRNCSGLDGDAYTTIQAAITAMNVGDYIIMRGGTYTPGSGVQECIDIPTSKNGSAWTNGNYNKLCSYQGEWAILDGQNNCGNRGVVIGHYSPDHDDAADIKYWLFERFEIKNGRTSGGDFASGFCGNGGPFIFRYLYVHDNISTSTGNNPAGLKGWHWQDTKVEFCYLKDNGYPSGIDDNPSNIAVYSDYHGDYWAEYGYTSDNPSYRPNARNEYRYNYMSGSNCGVKHKANQRFTGRNPGGGHGWDETYNTWGDKIHHNVVTGARFGAIITQQDFVQVYNNIIDACGIGITFRYQPSHELYKGISYNNTIINPSRIGLVRYADNSYAYAPTVYYGWDYNNVFDSAGGYSGWCATEQLNVAPYGATCSDNVLFDLTNYYTTKNYFYRPDDTDLYRLRNTSYTQSGFEAQNYTHTPRVAYMNNYDAGNLLYEGTTGVNKYLTRGAHQIEAGVTIADGGVGGSHPYLAGITFPDYVGATHPSNRTWVLGVVDSVTSTTWLRAQTTDEPAWVVGSSNDNSPPSFTSNLVKNGEDSVDITITSISSDTDTLWIAFPDSSTVIKTQYDNASLDTTLAKAGYGWKYLYVKAVDDSSNKIYFHENIDSVQFTQGSSKTATIDTVWSQ